MTAYRLTRDVWLSSLFGDVEVDPLGAPAGTTVYTFHKATYGCVSPAGIAVSVMPGEYPFFEAPRDALELSAEAVEQAAEEHKHDVAMGRYFDPSA